MPSSWCDHLRCMSNYPLQQAWICGNTIIELTIPMELVFCRQFYILASSTKDCWRALQRDTHILCPRACNGGVHSSYMSCTRFRLKSWIWWLPTPLDKLNKLGLHHQWLKRWFGLGLLTCKNWLCCSICNDYKNLDRRKKKQKHF